MTSSPITDDLRLPAEIDASALPDVPQRPPESILLTGATGFLGGFLLADLLDATRARIRCLVRGESVAQARERLADQLRDRELPVRLMSRVDIVLGSLAKPRFGLTDEEFTDLSRDIDAIYHCGAWVNLLASYPILRGCNVSGTREILRLATRTRRIPVHHVSTMGVIGADPVAGTGVSGYCATKWVAERLVAGAGDRGTPTTVYRPGVILADSRTGLVGRSDWFVHLTMASIRAGCAPDHPGLLPVGTVDFTSRAIVDLSLSRSARGQVFHVIDPEPLPFRSYFQGFADAGADLPLVPFDTWLERLRDAGDAVPRSTLRLAGETLRQMMPAPGRDTAGPTAAATHRAPPALDTAYFRRMLTFLDREVMLPAR
ncbi:thioester reductase domain-containing protein [Streptomyces fumanus]|uniref:Oxidoreductase n=1 Tax=Streptomyces fumanus TaxID=67302 RepID=A0A919A3V3_9ACTN|nr:thioester reductase domain-containing protein [Streptomyces fumanus]GHE84232.1 oxidoreductase [Streptomyces fumanus]